MKKKAKKTAKRTKKAKDLTASTAKAGRVKGGVPLASYAQYKPVSATLLRPVPPNPI